jgi:hypothetical protein
MFFPFLGLAASLIGGAAQYSAGREAARVAEINAQKAEFAGKLESFNLETERKLSVAEASQRHNDRLKIYSENLSSNIAALSSSGRDIGGSDRSVTAFLERQQEVAAGDLTRSDFMGQITSQKLKAESLAAKVGGLQRAAAIRADGLAAQRSATIGAFTTIAGGLYQYNQVR